MTFFKEFKEFAVKGNMVDMAVGIIIGAAFKSVIDSIVADLAMPFLSLFTREDQFNNWTWTLRKAVTENGEVVVQEAVVITYGSLVDSAIDFVIIALIVFIVIRFINRIRREGENEEDKSVPTPKNLELLAQIRDELKQLNEKAK